MQITLSHPVNYKDTELHTLDLDLDSLTGNDLIAVEDTLRASGQVNLFSQAGFAAIAARTAHVPVEILKGLPAKDFLKIENAVANFLSDTASPESGAENSGE